MNLILSVKKETKTRLRLHISCWHDTLTFHLKHTINISELPVIINVLLTFFYLNERYFVGMPSGAWHPSAIEFSLEINPWPDSKLIVREKFKQFRWLHELCLFSQQISIGAWWSTWMIKHYRRCHNQEKELHYQHHQTVSIWSTASYFLLQTYLLCEVKTARGFFLKGCKYNLLTGLLSWLRRHKVIRG